MKCGKSVYDRCVEIKRVTSTVEKEVNCERYAEAMTGIVKPAEEFTFYDQVELVKNSCFLGDRLNASDGSEAAVAARTRTGWGIA